MRLSTIIGLIITLLIIIGEVKCIIKAVNCDWQEPYRAEVIYTVSAFTGFGGIIGWVDITD